MAVRTIYHSRDGHWRFQAGHVLVYAGRNNGMERERGWIKFQPSVRLGYLPGYCRLRSVRIVRVTFETNFIFVLNALCAAAGGCYSGDSTHDAGDNRGVCRRVLNSVRIMTIDAFDVPD